MKGLYFTDKHDHPFNEFSKPTKDGRTTLLDEHYRTYDWISEQIQEHKPDFVVNLGDTVLTIGYVDALTITCVEYGDRRIRSACGMVGASYFPMIGNHDLMNDATRIHVLPFIDGLITDVCFRDGLFFLPFYRDVKASHPEKWMTELVEKSTQRAFIHNDIVGARFNAAAICKSGVNPSDFPGTCRVIAGHFHIPQALNRGFFCIGSCMYRDFGDTVVEEPRGIIVEEDDSWLRIPNPHTSMYQTIRVADEDELCEKLQAIRFKDRTHLRISYPENLQPFVDPYKPDFRSIKTVPLKERKLPMVNGVGSTAEAGLDPCRVLQSYLQSNLPSDFNVLHQKDHFDYITDVTVKVLSGVLKQRSRHHVRFLGLHAENFLPFLSLDVRFNETGVVHVDGVIQDQEADVSNGAGKSAIFEAINWCWFGELIRSSKELEGKVLIDDVVNDQAKSNCLVSMDVVVDETQYQVLRTRRHKDYGSDLRIFVAGGTEPTAQGIEQAAKYLKEITGADKDLFRHTTMLVDSLSTRFSQLSGRDRLELLEAVIQLDLYDQLYTVVNQDMKSAKAEHEGVKTSSDRDVQVLAELRSQRAALAENLDRIIHDLEAAIAAKQGELSKAVDESGFLDRVLEAQQAVARQLADAMSTAKAEIPRFDDHQYRVTTSGINRDLGIMRKALQDKTTLLTGICPTCNRPLEVDRLVTELEMGQVQRNIATFEASLKEWQDWEVTQRAAIKRFEEAAQQVEQKYNLHLEKIRGFGMQRSNLETKTKSLRIDIQQTTQTLDSNRSQLSSLDTRIGAVEAELVKLKDDLQKLAVKLAVRVYWDAALSPRGGVRMTLLQDALGQLNEFAVDFSNTISNGRVSPMLFITPKGEIGFETTQTAGARKYGLSSSGQRRMVDIGIQLALARLSSRYSGFSSNLLILDEVEDKLDASARRHLIALLEKISSEEQKLVLIASHNKDIKSFVDRVWLVVQSDGISRLTVAA